MGTENEQFITARKASGKTLAQITELAGLKSITTYMGREDDPRQFRLSELKGMYDGINDTAKTILLDAVNGIFLPS